MGISVMFMQSQSYFGADSYIHSLLMRYLDRESFKVHVACNSDLVGDDRNLQAITRLNEVPDIDVRPTDFGISLEGAKNRLLHIALRNLVRVPKFVLGLLIYVRKNNIRVIHCTEKPRDAFFGVLLGKLTGAKSVVHFHVKYADWLKPNVRWALRNADAIVGVSQFVADSLVSAGYDRARVHVVGNSLDLSQSKWDPTIDGSLIRREFAIEPDALVLGILARLFRWKGHSDLIDAVARIIPTCPNVRLLIVGEDDRRAHPGGGSYREELEAQIARLGLDENVIFTGMRTDIPQVLAALDVYAMPTFEEPSGVVFLEAMAMQKPIVAYNNGGAIEVVTPDCGILTPVGQIEALADAICTLLNDSKMRAAKGKAGRQRVETVLTPTRMAADVGVIYKSLLS